MPEVLTSDGPMAADEPDFTMFENKTGLAEDLKFLASIPELCDVTFLVGETREPVCAVKVKAKFLSALNIIDFSSGHILRHYTYSKYFPIVKFFPLFIYRQF